MKVKKFIIFSVLFFSASTEDEFSLSLFSVCEGSVALDYLNLRYMMLCFYVNFKDLSLENCLLALC